ncbi:RDD family protein [Aliiglaciecola sp. LCG003]|uniref:RDD family protein n=1 Tax=Aliiglaciecola sp. LCG003 TaxID=3053655 RepID=UPI002573E4D3|nr:RDD family protein [Aliiglaciecola sp. LCG003]WJG10332.1 RDD family protein [Aliiglaciecola sp. LCG003]
MPIDNQIQLETAEGIDIQITPAGIGVRTAAFVYDLLIRLVILAAAAMILGYLGQMGVGMMLIIYFFVEWLYPVVFEILKGDTPGKKAFGLAVVYDNGLPITLSGSLTRNLFRAIDFLPSFYFIGGICMVLTHNSKRLGDILAGSMVVYRQKPTVSHHFSYEKALNLELPLDTEAQNAIISFAERSKTLSKQRQQELANILSELVDAQGDEGVIKLKSVAAGLIGKS